MTTPRPFILVALLIVTGVAVFAFDLALPLGVAGGVPYVMPVLIALWLPWRWTLYTVAAIGTALTAVGYFLSPEGGVLWIVLVNRGLAIVALWVTAVLGHAYKRVEADIRAMNANLERRVDERTAELRAAQDVLLRKERLAALGQLTGTVAHELRNPLGAIATSISVLRHKAAGKGFGLERSLERAERGIKRCDTIITELLDFARAKGLQPQPVALDSWLSEVIGDQYIPDGITVEYNFRTRPATVEFDPDELRRVVINVVDNACQAMTDGSGENDAESSGTLTIATRLSGDRVEVEFNDTGPGIPDDVMSQVMEPLFSTKTFGTGLGLPTAQRILEAHGGGLSLDNRADSGMQVVFWLPVASGAPVDLSE